MRRWFEFGLDGSPFSGDWYLQSNRKNFRGLGESGSYPAEFVSMPYKDELFSFLQAMTSSSNLVCSWLAQIDQGVNPDPACGALHIPRPYSFIPPTNGLFINPTSFFTTGYPIFDNDTYTGSHSSRVFSLSGEPPTENG